MQRIFATALLASAALVHAQTPAAAAASAASAAPVSAAKKALVAKVILLEQPLYEGLAREIVMRPAMQLGQQANGALQNAPADKREAMAKSIDADIRKYIDESVPLLRDRAVKIGPEALTPIFEQKMSEAELKQLADWLATPAAKKYDQIGGELQQALGQKLFAEAGPLLTPKLQTLEGKVRGTLGIPAAGAAPAASGAAPAKPATSAAPAPAKAASK